MLELTYQLPYPPTINHYYIRTKRGVILTDRANDYRADVINAIGKSHTSVLGPIAVRVDAYMPDKRKRDLDNVFKALCDAMTHAGVWKDDSQIDDLRIVRRGVEAPGRVLVTVRQIDGR